MLLGLCAQLELDDAVLRAKIDSGKQEPPGTGPQPIITAYDDELGV